MKRGGQNHGLNDPNRSVLYKEDGQTRYALNEIDWCM